MPHAEAWRAIKNQQERLHVGLRAIYDWYERNADLAASVLRDGEYHALTKEMIALRYGPPMAAYYEVFGETLTAKQRAVLRLAVSFFTWRTLVREGGLEQSTAVRVMANAVCATYPR